MFSAETLHRTLSTYSIPACACCWIAYSGGLDSHVLLNSIVQLKPYYPHIHAIHIHHALSPNEDAWCIHCQKICAELEVPCLIRYVNPSSYTSNIEKTARDARYHIFSELLSSGSYLFTAHHQQDQAETVLLRLLRGTGIRGLSGIPMCRPLGKGLLLRPLLNVSKTALRKYAESMQLQWMEDETNTNTDYDRNYLRHHIFPQLKMRWPAAHATFSRAATHCQETADLLQDYIMPDLKKVQGVIPNTLSIEKLNTLSHSSQKNIIRMWLEKLGFTLPSQAQLREILRMGMYAKADAFPTVSWNQGKVEIRRFQKHLYVMHALLPHDATCIIHWDLQSPLCLPAGIGKLVVKTHGNEGIYISDTAQITVRFRQGGESLQPVGRAEMQLLKKLFQTWHVPPWNRNRIPLIYLNNELVMIPGYTVAQRYAIPSRRRMRKLLLECLPELS